MWLYLILPTTCELSAVVTSIIDMETDLKKVCNLSTGNLCARQSDANVLFLTTKPSQSRSEDLGYQPCLLGRAFLLFRRLRLFHLNSIQTLLSQGAFLGPLRMA